MTDTAPQDAPETLPPPYVENTDPWVQTPGVAYSTVKVRRNGQDQLLTQAEAAALFPTASLDDLRATKVAAIQAAFGARIAAGFSYQGQSIAIDDGSRANLTACAVEAMLVAQGADTWPADYAKGWITLAGTRIPLPAAADGLALARAAGGYYAALAQHGQDLELAAGAASTAAGVAALDETAGWPANTSTAPVA